MADGGGLLLVSKREAEVCSLVRRKSNREVAEILGIAVGTVKVHRKRLMRKLHLRNTAELIRLGVREGIGKIDDVGEPDEVTLSARERQLLGLVGLGYTNFEIADQLGVSPNTVEAHRKHIRRKVGVSSMSQLVRYAIRHG